MSPPLRPLTNIPAPVLPVLAAIATQRSVVHAQSRENLNSDNPYYYYWLSPGRIAGIAVGAIVLIFLILSMLILACRRRRHAKAISKVMVSNVSGQPQQFPSWQGQQPVQTPYGPDATNVGWHYPAQGTAPFDQAKSTASSGQAQRTAPSEQAPSTAPFGEVQRPAFTSQVLSTPTSGQVQRPPPTSQVQTTVPSGQVQTTTPPGQAQRYAPPGRVQSIAPAGRTQSAAPSVRAQEQGAPIPPPRRHAHTKGTPSPGAANGRDQSPPPYYPPTPPTPPPAHTAR